MKKFACVSGSLVLVLAAFPAFSQGYKHTDTIHIGGTGGWDYLTADAQNRPFIHFAWQRGGRGCPRFAEAGGAHFGNEPDSRYRYRG
jgi:hypothetical protein